nr:insulinase family protein [Amylibacter sp.]
MIFKRLLILTLLFTLPFSARAELIATDQDPKVAQLNPLRNGLSAITFVWGISDFAMNRIVALNAGLSTAISGGTPDMTPFEAETYREVNGISLGISTQNNDLMLTLSAPHAVFPTALTHLNALLRNPDFSRQWYKRQSLNLAPVKVTKNRRPSHVINVLSDYVRFPVASDGVDSTAASFTFGMPRQVIIRTTERDTAPLIQSAVDHLPLRDVPLPVTNKPDRPIDLPKGIIFAPDPDAHETLILAVHHSLFDDADHQIAANLLLDYMGAYQGSEMFRIIRQEMRAAYDPSTAFEQTARDQALMSLSATVSANDWPQILKTMQDIYTRTRDGDVGEQGFTNNQRRLLRGYEYQFATNPAWSASQFLSQYPDGTTGEIKIPLFNALVKSTLETATQQAADSLPPFSDYLILLIGGSVPPEETQKQRGYCELSLTQPLRHCLEQLQAEQD